MTISINYFIEIALETTNITLEKEISSSEISIDLSSSSEDVSSNISEKLFLSFTIVLGLNLTIGQKYYIRSLLVTNEMFEMIANRKKKEERA